MKRFRSNGFARLAGNHLFDLEKPSVPAGMPMLADEEGVWMIPVAEQLSPLAIVIEHEWPDYELDYEAGMHLRFELGWKNRSSPDYQVVQTLPDIPMPPPGNWTPVVGAVPALYLRSAGVFDVVYRITVVEHGNDRDTPAASVNLDKTAPNSGNPGTRLALLEPTDLIDDAYLLRHADQVPVTIGAWPDLRLEDKIEVFLEPARGSIADPVMRTVIGPEHLNLRDIPLTLAGDEIRRKGDGARFVYYRLTDRAGNIGPVSVANPVQISVGLATLNPVVIKGLTADNVLVAEDANQPVSVELTLHEDPVAGDVLELHWGSLPQVVSRYTVLVSDRGGSIVQFPPVPYGVVQAAGEGVAVPVHYFRFDGSTRQRAPVTSVRVEFAALGPFASVSFPTATLWGWINCDASKPWMGIPVAIPGNTQQLAEGDSVELSWQMFRGQVGNGQQLTDELKLPAHLLTAQEARDGVVLSLQPQHFIDWVLTPLRAAHEADRKGAEGSASVRYRIIKRDGRHGTSSLSTISISLQRPGGLVCSGA